MSLLELLDRPIAYHRCFAKLAGSVTSGIFLSQCFYWSQRTSDSDGWFWKTRDEWTEETCLTRREQESARKALIKIGVLQEKLVGLPAKIHYRLLAGVVQSRLHEMLQPAGANESSKLGGSVPTGRADLYQLEGRICTNNIYSEITNREYSREYFQEEEEGGTAIADRSSGEWPVSSPPLSFPEKENSQHPEQPKETINTAETPQGNDGSFGHIDSLDKPRAGGDNTRNLVYGGNIHKIMALVGIGQSSGLWTSQESLAAFQAALMRELDRLGRKEPARALTAILKGVERRSTPEIEEVRKYWARFDGKEIIPIPAAALPWVGTDGRLDAGYVAWVRANASALDGELPDGTYKVDLILQARSSNKLAVAAWESYQKELRYQSWIDAEALRKQREWDERTALLEAERAAKLARADYATAC